MEYCAGLAPTLGRYNEERQNHRGDGKSAAAENNYAKPKVLHPYSVAGEYDGSNTKPVGQGAFMGQPSPNFVLGRSR
jgi:hypothetical protein